MAKFKPKTNYEVDGKRVSINVRVLEGERRDLEILVKIAEGIHSLQDLFDVIVKDTLKQNKKLIEDYKHSCTNTQDNITSNEDEELINEDEELNKLIAEEEKKK